MTSPDLSAAAALCEERAAALLDAIRHHPPIDHPCLRGEARELKTAAAAIRALRPSKPSGWECFHEKQSAKLLDKLAEDADEQASMRNAGRIHDGREDHFGAIAEALTAAAEKVRALSPEGGEGPSTRDDWHEDCGPVLWWNFPIAEPPYAGTPLDDDFPEYKTHWTRIPLPASPGTEGGQASEPPE